MVKDKGLYIVLDALIKTKTGNELPIGIYDWVIRKEIIPEIRKLGKRRITIITNNDLLTERMFLLKINTICNTLERILRRVDTIHFLYETDPESYRYLPNEGMILEDVNDNELNYKDTIIILRKKDINIATNTKLNYIIV